MDQNTSRWMQIVLMDPDDLAGLHAREKYQATRLPASENKPRFQVDGRGTWEATLYLARAMEQVNPDGYWPNGMDESARVSSVRAFEAAVYPLWASIKKKDAEKEAAMTSAQVSEPGQVLYECATLHRQDRAIHNSGIKTRRVSNDQSRMEDIRRRAVRASS